MRTMLITLLAIIFGLIAHPAQAAQPHSGHHAPVSKMKVVSFGDSITWGVGTDHPARQSWPARIGAKRVAHAGAGLVGPRGDQKAAVETYRGSVLKVHPNVTDVTLAYGMNDLHWSTTPEIMAGLRQVVRWNRVAGVETWVATLTPLGREFPWGLDEQRRELNDRIRATFGDHVLDFNDALIDEFGYLPNRYDSGDGLHPNARAYMKLAAVAREALIG